MKNMIDERIQDLQNWAVKSQREQEERHKRLLEAVVAQDKCKYIWLYESSPCDYWNGWSDVLNAGYIFNHRKMMSNDEDMHSEGQLSTLEILLIQALSKFGYLFCNDWRGTHLKFIEVENFTVIAGKCDNNGICYAFSSSRIEPKKIPHDNEDWQLIDCRKLNEMD